MLKEEQGGCSMSGANELRRPIFPPLDVIWRLFFIAWNAEEATISRTFFM